MPLFIVLVNWYVVINIIEIVINLSIYLWVVIVIKLTQWYFWLQNMLSKCLVRICCLTVQGGLPFAKKDVFPTFQSKAKISGRNLVLLWCILLILKFHSFLLSVRWEMKSVVNVCQNFINGLKIQVSFFFLFLGGRGEAE